MSKIADSRISLCIKSLRSPSIQARSPPKNNTINLDYPDPTRNGNDPCIESKRLALNLLRINNLTHPLGSAPHPIVVDRAPPLYSFLPRFIGGPPSHLPSLCSSSLCGLKNNTISLDLPEIAPPFQFRHSTFHLPSGSLTSQLP
jgi:hypothetical protein